MSAGVTDNVAEYLFCDILTVEDAGFVIVTFVAIIL
jgi:hypothetical protein